MNGQHLLLNTLHIQPTKILELSLNGSSLTGQRIHIKRPFLPDHHSASVG